MDIDKSKENIQPLRGGRNVHQLGTALQAQSDVDAQRQLLLQKEEHEALITNYEGPDPLDPWFNYIQWVEQCFPKHGHEGHIDQIIKECLHRFEKDERYFQDRRFVKLWIKYIDCLTNPLEIYQRLYSSGIGIQCAELYRAWACYCVESGDYKKANQVYILGLQANAQPIEELKEAHTNFHIFYAQRMLHSDDSPTKRKADSALAETRLALTSLRTFKRRNISNAPIQRTGDSIRNPLPGVVRQQVAGANANRAGAGNIAVNIYEDAPSTSQMPVPVADVETVPSSVLQVYNNMENEKEVGIWTNSRTSKTTQPTVPRQPLPFTPYEDEGQLLLGPNHLPYCAEDLNSSIALCVPDPPDPSKIPCYNKTAVYADNTEYSLEEIRARKFTLRKVLCPAKSMESVPPSHSQTPVTSSPGLKYMYRTRQTMSLSTMTSDNDQLEQFIPLGIPAVQNVTDIQNVESPGEPQVLVNLDSNEYNSTNVQAAMSFGPATSTAVPTSSHMVNLKTSHGCPDRYKSNESRVVNNECDVASNLDSSIKNFGPPVDEYNRSLIDNMHADSVTLNTKEARWELRNLFNDNEPSMVQPVIPQFDTSQFNIHEDRSMTIALKKKSLAPSQRMEEMPQMAIPEDKENGPQSHRICTMPANPASNSTIVEEDPSMQTFNFNLKVSSTPNIAHFKKPQVFMDISAKTGAVKKFNTADGVADVAAGGDHSSAHSHHLSEEALQTFNTDTSPNNVLSAIIEESYSKSGSSSGSVQQTRSIATYNTRDGQTHENYEPPTQPAAYESPAHVQPRLANGQFARTHPPQSSAPPALENQPYGDVDHHYQKNANRFAVQRAAQTHTYRQAYAPTEAAYRVPSYSGVSTSQPSFSGTQTAQREFAGPTTGGYAGPRHVGAPGARDPGLQSPSRAPVNYSGSQATYHGAQFGYQTPGPDNRLGYTCGSRSEYAPAQSGYVASAPHSPFRSPPHRSPGYVQHFRTYPHDASYTAPSGVHAQQESQLVRPDTYPSNHSFHGPNYAMHVGTIGSSNLTKPENQNYNSYHGGMHQTPYQAYQSPAHNQLQHSQFNNSISVQQNAPAMQTPSNKPRSLQPSPSESYTNTQQLNYQQNGYLHHQSTMHQHAASREVSYALDTEGAGSEAPKTYQSGPMSQQPTPSPSAYKSPTSVLRSVRHEQQHKTGTQHSTTLPDGGYSNQFLNFITSKNEPKDNAHTPKFGNSPNISQKMHKNLYVSSPEQAPMPATTTATEAKGLTVPNNATPIQSAKVTTTQQKDISKRHLDFDHRTEFQSEDSRDSLSKESRISSVRSRQSLQSDSFGMDVDSENSMECHTFKSTCSNSTVETKDVPRPAAVDFPDVINPFNNELCNTLLQYVKFPNRTHCEGYVEVRSVPKLQQGVTLTVGSGRYSIEKQLGKGTYGSVFASLDLQSNKLVALKYQKPGHPWEFYICKEIKSRIKDPFMLPGYMDVNVAYFGDSASIFVSELSKYGSLLDVANKVKVATSKCINESIVMLLTTEMLSIVHYLHKAEIIHADMKPDNFLLMKIPTSEWRTPSLQLIDLGCAIDMSLFPERTSFKKVVSTEGFTCTEMRERRSWTYQTDLYCLAGTIHVILLGSYMKTVNRLGQWNIDKKLPRYMQGSLWDKVFTTLLNVPDCQSFPDLMDLKNDLEMYCSKDDVLTSQLRSFANVLMSR